MTQIFSRHQEKTINLSFICVGPERTGTSWLYVNLQHHPSVFLTPVKEIRYFYELVHYPNERVWSRLSKRGDWHAQDYRSYLRERIRSYVRDPYSLMRGWDRVRWDYRFLFGRRNDEWYLSLFEHAGDRLAGDISPQYFSLPESHITRIRNLFPALKVIILLRDPIEWSWSFARMTLLGNQTLEDVSDEDFVTFFHRYMNYYPTVTAINKWRRFFSLNQVHIGFYDRLSETPLTFYGEVCDFLGIDSQQTPQEVLDGLCSRVNAGRSLPLPLSFAVLLARVWRHEIEQLCQLFSPYPQRWRQRCNEFLALENHV